MRGATVRGVAAGLLCTILSGCAGFWDEVTSRDFSMSETLRPPEPMSVLRTSQDGDKRAKAFRRLEEPARNGSPGTQDEVVKLLTDAALGDPQPICRMAAISTLGRFQDSRAVPALINAYESADQLAPELAYLIRCQALSAMGETKQPAAGEYLAKIAAQPVRNDASDRERGQTRDIRLAAVRSLRNFPQMPAATQTAAALAQTEKDVAVRDRARETYTALTGHEPATMPPAPPVPNPVQAVKHEEPAKP
ncbi:MAG: HEAT repeat domain-containing protein [Gemmataceae bacterium]